MKVMAVNHDVEDYAKWKAEFDAFPRAEGGALFHRINRNVDDPNNITVVHGFETIEAAKAFVDDPRLREAMERAGVAGPRVSRSTTRSKPPSTEVPGWVRGHAGSRTRPAQRALRSGRRLR